MTLVRLALFSSLAALTRAKAPQCPETGQDEQEGFLWTTTLRLTISIIFHSNRLALLGRADCGPQLHDGLVEVARPIGVHQGVHGGPQVVGDGL